MNIKHYQDTPNLLKTLNKSELLKIWHKTTTLKPPNRKEMLIRQIAWKLQAQKQGGLPKATRQLIVNLIGRGSRTKQYKPVDKYIFDVGTVISRKFKGGIIQVYVTKGGFDYQGKSYKTLTTVASSICGYHQSGTVFFGIGK